MMKIEKVNTWEVDIVLYQGFESRGGAITALIYSKHEISDCDRQCCQNIKCTHGGHMGHIPVCSLLSENGTGNRVNLNKHNELKQVSQALLMRAQWS